MAVIGAGPSGLAAAKHALEAGLRRDRVRGGRRPRRPVAHDRRAQRRVAGHAHEHEPRDDRVLGLRRARRPPAPPRRRADPRLPARLRRALRRDGADPPPHARWRTSRAAGRSTASASTASSSPPAASASRASRPGSTAFGGELIHAFDYPGAEPLPRPPHARLRQRHQRAGDRVRPRAGHGRGLGVPQAPLRDPEGRRRRLVGLAVVHGVRRARAPHAAARRAGPHAARPGPARRRRPRRLRRARAGPRHLRGGHLALPGLPRPGRRRRASPAGRRSPRSTAAPSPSPTARPSASTRSCARRATTLDIPYLDDDVWAVLGPDLALYRRTLHPDLPGFGVIGQFLAQGPYFPLLELQARWIVADLGGRRPAARRGAHARGASPSPGRRSTRTTRSRRRSPRSSASRRTCSPGPRSPRRCCSARCCRRATGSTARARRPTPPRASPPSSPLRRGRRSSPPTSRRCAASGSARPPTSSPARLTPRRSPRRSDRDRGSRCRDRSRSRRSGCRAGSTRGSPGRRSGRC